MDYLNFIKPDVQLYGTFANHKSAVACAFHRAFSFDLGSDVFLLRWWKEGKSGEATSV